MQVSTTKSEVLTPDIVADVQALQIFARHIVDGFNNGRHASRQNGFSTQFKQHRSYVPGDQIRLLDWKLFAKTDRLYVRQFEEEINLQSMVLVDNTASMNYAGSRAGGVSKYQYGCALSAALSYLMLMQQDAIGAVRLGPIQTANSPSLFLPPRSKPNYLQDILHCLVGDLGATVRYKDFNDSLASVASRLSKRSLLFIISDLLDDTDLLLKTVKLLRSAGNDIVIFQVWDADEEDFPFRENIDFRDLELGSNAQLDCRAIATRYKKNVAAFQSNMLQKLQSQKIDYVRCLTNQSIGAILRQYLSARNAR